MSHPLSPETAAQSPSWRWHVSEAVWSLLSRLVLRWLPARCNPVRVACLRLFGARVPFSSFVDGRARILWPFRLRLGERCHVAHNVILDCSAGITIGPGSRISQYSHLCCDTCDESQRRVTTPKRPIVIGNDVWLAADVYVAGGVNIGDRAIIGARSSVFEDIPPNAIAVQSPAQIVGWRPSSDVAVAPLTKAGDTRSSL